MDSNSNNLVCRCGHGLGWHECKDEAKPHGTFTCKIDRLSHGKCLFNKPYKDSFPFQIDCEDCACAAFAANNLEFLENKYLKSL